MNYAELIRSKRRALKLTQAELAEKLDTSQTQITRYENGTNTPSPNTWKDIKRVLEIEEEPDDLTKTPPTRKDDGAGENFLYRAVLRLQEDIKVLEQKISLLEKQKNDNDS